MKPLMDTDEHKYDEITFMVNGCAMDVLNSIGHGFHEKIYENALAIAFENKGLSFSKQKQYPINFAGRNVGVFIPDFVINDQIIVEIKAIEKITNVEQGQVLNYLRASTLKLGIILNFKHPKLEWKRLVL